MRRTAPIVAGFFLVLLGGFFLSSKPVSAQNFSFSPSSVTKKIGEEFTVDLSINTGGQAVRGADAKITFDATLLEVVTVANGGFFPKGGYNIESGLLYVSYGFDQALQTKAGSGVFAKVTLKGKKSGTAALTWSCSSQTSDTNIWDTSNNDIVSCSSMTNASYSIIEGGGTTPQATATPTIIPTGMTAPTFFGIGFGLLLTIIGVAFTI